MINMKYKYMIIYYIMYIYYSYVLLIYFIYIIKYVIDIFIYI